MGSINHADFQTAYSVSLNAKRFYQKTVFVELPKQVAGSVLIYSKAEVDPPIITHETSLMSFPRGDDKIKTTARVIGDLDFSAPFRDCAAFTKWSQGIDANQLTGIALIMPYSLWCPESAMAIYQVVVADFHKRTRLVAGEPQEILSVTWAKYEKEEFGEVPAEIQSVF